MSLDVVRTAKEKGRQAVLFSIPQTHDPKGGEVTAFALITPNSTPVSVDGKEGYGSGWGDATEPEAWQRLPGDM